ncbi:MAG: hypothetical protein Q7K55_03555 [Candidatus Levybacteria bacterium]|nr:hypothetical protein [Candidatus Levybacteria bacterium]
MAIEAFERAYHMLGKLQTSEDFEHFGQESRGIRIQTESLVVGIAEMITHFPEAREPLTLMAALIELASEDYGTYIRVKGGSRYISVDVRGHTGHVREDMSFEELSGAIMRRSGVNIGTDFKGKSSIGAHSDYLQIDDQEVGSVINKSLEMLPEQRRAALADAFLNVVVGEVAQSGEFLNL